MKIHSFDQIDSTSTKAAELTQQGEMRPFAVLSSEQTSGRGRSGKTWSSPPGGIYLSLVIDHPQNFPAQHISQLPLRVATAVAQWLWQEFAFRVTIKWPNDLLFAGQKLGGILCESSIHGEAWGPHVLGVGLNLQAAPKLSDQPTIAIEQIISQGVELGPLELAESLARFLELNVFSLELSQLFPEFALEPGQLWVDSKAQLVALSNVSSQGTLAVRELSTGAEQSLSSVRHDFQWIYQQEKIWPLLVADIGNSLIKIGLYRNPRQSSEAPEIIRLDPRLSLQDQQAQLKLLGELNLAKKWGVHAISVADAARIKLAGILELLGFTLHEVPKRAIQVKFDGYKFTELGIDRVAMVESIRARLPARNLLLVSAGTCTTVEVLRQDGYYLGGYILPGLQMQLDAMHENTARLPHIKLSDIDSSKLLGPELLGVDTRSAMVRGVLNETCLTMLGLKQRLEAESGSGSWSIVCTGGAGKLISQYLHAPYLPHLILDGVALMVLGGRTVLGSTLAKDQVEI